MNGAQTLIRTLADAGVNVCFSNPGTSEMHFVAALDSVPEMRGILCLFEGVATGAADGYGRMADKPAATLLHLGPGLANGMANLHNAMRARTPIVNIVGDHATYHKQYDAPLESDVEGYCRLISDWVRTSSSSLEVASDAAQAVAAAMQAPGRIANLILPADVSWSPAKQAAVPIAPTAPGTVPGTRVDQVAAVLKSGEPAALLLGGATLRLPGLTAASRVTQTTGAKLLAETFPARLERGAGVPAVERLNYLAEFTMQQLAEVKHLIVVETKPPVSFFAYPEKPSYLVPDGCQVHVLAEPGQAGVQALLDLADAVGAAPDCALPQAPSRPDRPSGAIDAETLGYALGAVLPENAIVADEGNTAGVFTSYMSAGAPPHTWLTLTGGAIGLGMPMATGAAVACPDRKVINIQADGSAMYTLQSLWTQAREGLDVTTVLLNNRSYAILNMELGRVGAEAPGPKALEMLDLSGPNLDFTALAKGMGVQTSRVSTAEDLTDAMERALDGKGPHLIEAIL